jgi:UDP-N-acetylmuramoylalanine--D-glutamate ligase
VKFSELDGATVGVWGAGREIRSFANQLARHLPSARIAVVALDDPGGAGVAPELGDARVVDAGEAVAALSACDAVVRSPGVSIHRPELRALSQRGVPVTTATALWLAQSGGAGVVGVTGTKGKSTTAMLVAHLARAAGRTVALAGNIGVPVLDLLGEPPAELVVLELSSYQIADLVRGPEVAVFTNLHPEHVDWHGSDAAYRADKLRLLGLPGVRSTVVNGRDARLVAAARACEAAITLFGLPDGWDVTAAGVELTGTLVVPASQLVLRGEHNALNLCAALAALGAAGVSPPELPGALDGLRALPHRLEVVADVDGVLWVDDSISTTPESTLAALQSFADRTIVLVAGGQDRQQDHEALAHELAARGAAVIGLPVTGARLVDAARDAGVPEARAVRVEDMGAAVAAARTLASAGSAVLLSPAAPSYNAYRDFEERGADFRARIADRDDEVGR